MGLAQQLSKKRSNFDLRSEMNISECLALPMPMSREAGFALFDPYFSELRYPQELKRLGGVGPDETFVLNQLVLRLQPLLN